MSLLLWKLFHNEERWYIYSMTREFIYDQIRHFRLAVLATTSGDYQPEAAVVGIAITRELEVVFDTVRSSRKYRNLIAQPKVALVIGWRNETTIQFEGDAVELGASENDGHRGSDALNPGTSDDVYRETYYAVFPDGRDRTATWEGLTHFVIRPRWIRYSNFNEPVSIEELRF